jgi:hypothetical protein
MNLGGQRQHPRVQLDTAVRLRRGADGPWLHARALDLSEGGVRLQVHEGMPIGSEVRCSLPLLGERGSDLELLGTVAWVEGSGERPDTKTLVRLGNHEAEPTHHRRSMGLRFSPLPADDAERVRMAVRGAAARPCDVMLALEGRSDQVKARAEPTAEGLLLRAPLPVVRPGAAVGVRFASDGDSVVGVVKSVSLVSTDGGAPELRIELGGRDPSLGDPAADQADRPSGSSGALMNPAQEDEVADAAQDPDDTVEVFVPTRQRGASGGFVVVIGLACTALGLVLGVLLARSAALPPIGSIKNLKEQSISVRPVAPPTVAPEPAAPLAEAPSAGLAPLGVPLAGTPSTEPAVPATGSVAAESPAALVAAPQTAEPAAAAPPVAYAEPGTDLATATAPAPEPALPLVPEVLTAAAQAEPEATESAGQGLQVSTLGRVTRVRIPITGSGDGMRVYDLSSPGLTVNLPGAATPVRLGNFAVNTGLARRVWLRKLEQGGLQVRVIYTRGAVRPEVSAESGALTIDLSL